MGKIILGLLVGSLAFGQYSPPSSLPGSTYVWNGIPLTGVSTGSTVITNVASGSAVTLHTAPAGKRSFVFASQSNPTATTATYALNKVNGVNSCGFFTPATQAGPSSGTAVAASTVLEPGESMQASVSVSGQLNFVGEWMDFDASVPLHSPTLYGGFASGDNPIYTVPAGTTALLFPRSSLGLAPGASSTFAVGVGDVTVASNIFLKIGGVAWFPASAQVTGGTGLQYSIPGILTSGTAVVLNSSAAGTTNCFIMPTLWERTN